MYCKCSKLEGMVILAIDGEWRWRENKARELKVRFPQKSDQLKLGHLNLALLYNMHLVTVDSGFDYSDLEMWVSACSCFFITSGF